MLGVVFVVVWYNFVKAMGNMKKNPNGFYEQNENGTTVYRAPKIEKHIERKRMEKQIKRITPALVRALITPALGEVVVYKIVEETDSKGKVLSRQHVIVTDKDEIRDALDRREESNIDPDGNYVYITTRPVDVKANIALLDRAYGKPKESVDISHTVTLDLVELGRRAEQLIAERNKSILPPPAK